MVPPQIRTPHAMSKERIAELRRLSGYSLREGYLVKECLDYIQVLEEALAHYRNVPPPHPPPAGDPPDIVLGETQP